MADEQKTPTTTPPSTPGGDGLDPKLAGLLSYLFLGLGGLIVYLTQKDKFARFHGMQSIMLAVVIVVVDIAIVILQVIIAMISSTLSCITGLLFPLVGLGVLVLWIYLMIKAYGGEKTKLPIIGDMAEKYE